MALPSPVAPLPWMPTLAAAQVRHSPTAFYRFFRHRESPERHPKARFPHTQRGLARARAATLPPAFAAIPSRKKGCLLVGSGARFEHSDWLIHMQDVAAAAVRLSSPCCCHLMWTEGLDFYTPRARLERATRVGLVQTKPLILLTPCPLIRFYNSLQYEVSEQRPGHLLFSERIPVRWIPALGSLAHVFWILSTLATQQCGETRPLVSV